MPLFSKPIPLSLYIHLPWCVKKCPYCDFNSHKAPESLPEELYLKALQRDFDSQLPNIWGRRFISIFFGGGTPSLFSPKSIETLLQYIHARIPFSENIEITLEANPGTIDESRFTDFKQAGINRLSIGIQSLQNEKLKQLGRIHDRQHALRAIEKAIHAGFENFNLDLMHGLPNQSVKDAIADLQDALQFDPPHLSWYQLTIEPNTFFHAKPPVLPEEIILEKIDIEGKQLLQKNKLEQYEVSAFAKKDKQCIHNKNYWEFGDYLGIGAGSHSKITDFSTNCVRRHSIVKHPNDYMNSQKNIILTNQILREKDLIFEFMLNALRLSEGTTKELFSERTGLSVKLIESTLKKLQEKKLLVTEENKLILTIKGKLFLNDVIKEFL